MKKIITLSLVICFGLAYSQIAINKSPDNKSAILDFKEGTNLGLLLPKVTDKSLINTAGTLYFDTDTKRVHLKNNTSTQDLSQKDGDAGRINSAGEPQVIIGSETSTAKGGALILESDDKALIVPKVADPHLNIVNPDAGTIVYDTNSKLIAIFNGKQWSFWNNQ